MTDESRPRFELPTIDRLIPSGLCFLLAIFALITPWWPGTNIAENIGSLVVWLGLIEIYDGFKRAERISKRFAQISGAISLTLGTLLLNAILFRPQALYLFITAVFTLDLLRYIVRFVRSYRAKTFFWFDLFAAAISVVIVLLMVFLEKKGHGWIFSVAIFIRMTGIGIILLTAKTGVVSQVHEDVLGSLGMTGDPYVTQVAERVKSEEDTSAVHDRGWIVRFIFLLFFIHLGRMGLDRSLLGILSPVLATLGDAVIALIITYAILAPVRLSFLGILRQRGQRLWKWIEIVSDDKRKWFSLRSLAARWLTGRIRNEIRYRKAGYSFLAAVRTGLKMGLPWSALLAAVMPVLGMSWYFDTENWASGVWDRWAATRADHWRMDLTNASGEGYGAKAFRLNPKGVTNQDDFSFMVIGDPGEGDASQLILKNQILEVSQQPDVKFIVISSDVVYPTGALRDYERKFWMPFNGVHKPVYAIPGNHDWYDALDGFVVTFFSPAAAKKAILARMGGDLNISSNTVPMIDDMIAKSAEWRKEYEVPTGFQNAPFFQVSTDNFVFISIETGVVRQIDSLQRKWITNILNASKGKFVMALMGHPFYAIGEYEGKLNPDFDSLHALLRRYNVPLVMAGDTHDLEYYKELSVGKGTSVMHHFVNGGGGAYLSIGAAMSKPEDMPTKDYAFYPSYDPLAKKITDNTKWYKYPAWWWARKLDGWPFSAEWLSAMFDYNVSPYFQSFMKIKVEPSLRRVVLIPYSNHGRIKWRDMTSTSGSRPDGASLDDFAEWVIPMQ